MAESVRRLGVSPQVDVRQLAAAIYGAIYDVNSGTAPEHVIYNLVGLLSRSFSLPAPDAAIVAEFGHVAGVSAGLDAALAGDHGNSDAQNTVNTVREWLAGLPAYRASLIEHAATAEIRGVVRLLAHYTPEEEGTFGTDEARQIIREHGCAFMRIETVHPLDEGESVSLSVVAGTPREEVIAILQAAIKWAEAQPAAFSLSPVDA